MYNRLFRSVCCCLLFAMSFSAEAQSPATAPSDATTRLPAMVQTPPDPSTDTSHTFPAWQQGYLDIHHINTGRGNAAFLIMPDGTTMIIDAGDMDRTAFEKQHYPLKAAPAKPSDTCSAATAIVNYIRQVSPRGENTVIDYALITHFHADHYGQITESSPSSVKGNYKLAGITAVGDQLPIKRIIDRGYPAYDFPIDLRTYYKAAPSSFLNYLDFVKTQVAAGTMTAAALEAGRNDQITLQFDPAAYPGFHIRNIKVNNKVWTGRGNDTQTIFSSKDMVDKKGNFNENPLSLALKISYGKFDYYTGGDNTGREGDDLPGGRDTETPMAPAIGNVDAMSLDHHGNRDASNAAFLRTLQPQVVIAQIWCSDQPGQEIAHRLVNRKPIAPDLFFLYMHEETKVTLGPWITRPAKSLEGHVVLRVKPGGNEFYVYVLDDSTPTLQVKARFGPYQSE